MASLLSALFTPKAYRTDREKEKHERSLKGLIKTIGTEAIAGHPGSTMQIGGPDSLVSDLGGMIEPQEATGLFANASPAMASELRDLLMLAESESPNLRRQAQASMDELFIKRPTDAASKPPSSYQEYLFTDETPTGKEYKEFLLTGKKALGGIGGGAMSLKDIQDVGIRNAEGILRPVSDPALTTGDIQTGAGLAPGESYEVMPTAGERDLANAREASLRGWNEINNLLLTGDDPLFGDDYKSDWGSQFEGTVAEFKQANPKLAVYTSLLDGMAAQFARNISGEKGALRTDDIERAKGLFPAIPRMTMEGWKKGDTKATAMLKMDILTRLLQLPPKTPKKEVEKILDEAEAAVKVSDKPRYVWDPVKQERVLKE